MVYRYTGMAHRLTGKYTEMVYGDSTQGWYTGAS